MKLIESVLPLLTIFSLDTGQETAPAVPDWAPPGQPVKRVISRVIQKDGNVTIYEQVIEYEPIPIPAEPQPYEFETYLSDEPAEPWELRVVADYLAGRAVWIGGPSHPLEIRQLSAHSTSAPANRVVLQE